MVRVDLPLLSDFRIMSGIGVFRMTCLVLHVLLTHRGVDSYSTGPPTSSCGDMTPCSTMTYGVGPQTLSSSPYTVQPTVTCFSPGQTIYIYVDTSPFKGIFVEVKSAQDNNTNYGTFNTLGDPDLKTLNCFGQSNSGLSHTSNNLKSSKTFGWVAPQNYQGSDLQIVVTLVYNRTVYWVGIRTPMPVCGSDASIAPPPPASSSTTTTTTTTTTPFVPGAPSTTPFVALTTQTSTRPIAPAASSTPFNPPSIPATTPQLQPQPSGGPVSFSADQYAYLRPKSRLCHRKHWLAVCRRW